MIRAGLGNLSQLIDSGFNSLINTPFEIHGVHAGGDRLQTLAEHGLGQYGRGGGSIARYIRGLGSDFLDHLGTHVLEFILELDLFCDRDAVLGDGRRAERLVKHHVPAFWAQRDLDGVCKHIDATQFGRAGGLAEFDFFS